MILIKPKPFLNLTLKDISAMEISPSGDFIVVNA
jgi:hypothetical protein